MGVGRKVFSESFISREKKYLAKAMLYKMNNSFREKFGKIRADLEEHLNAINENSSEIQSLFDYLQDLETKIEKVSSRLDCLQLEKDINLTQKIQPLNSIEKQIFLTLYTEELPLNFQQISEKAKVSSMIVQEAISSLIHKGIPISRSFFNNQMFLQLETVFKERQAKENLINLSLTSFF